MQRRGPGCSSPHLVELGGDEPPQRRIVEPAHGEERSLDPPDLAQGRGEAVLLLVGGTSRFVIRTALAFITQRQPLMRRCGCFRLACAAFVARLRSGKQS